MEKKLTLWAAVGRNGDTVRFYDEKPSKFGGCFYNTTDLCGSLGELPCDMIGITFENSPVEVELTIKIKE